jgi:hypothetical protein
LVNIAAAVGRSSLEFNQMKWTDINEYR